MDGHARWGRGGAVALVLLAASIMRQPQAAGASKGCSAEFHKFCNQQNASSADQATCLRQYWVSLSQDCRRSLGAKSSSGSNGSSGSSGDSGVNSPADEQTK
jgi:hypothetical protein